MTRIGVGPFMEYLERELQHMNAQLPVHSPKGASSAERWMNCPGSNVILQSLDLPPTDEEDFTVEGSAGHDAAADLLRAGTDAWEAVGSVYRGVTISEELVDGIQFYLDAVRRIKAEQDPAAIELIEERISGNFDPMFYGTVDHSLIGGEILDVNDLKLGKGIAVDAVNNAQLKYYAVGILEKHMGPTRVRLRIIQPRAFHPDGPVREWETTSTELRAWKNDVLIPAMKRAEFDHTLTPGDWCRFCPAKIACPLLTSLFGASITADASHLANYSNEALARNYALIAPVKSYIKELEKQVYERLNRGEAVDDGSGHAFKLVPKKANRVWAPAAVTEAKAKFGAAAFTEPEMKSPAQIDLLACGKDFTKEYAYTPMTGLTVAPQDDPRIGVRILDAAEAFSHVTEPAA